MLYYQILQVEYRRYGHTSNSNKENYHPSKRENRAVGAEGSFSPNASIPASTPVTIDATAAHVDTTIALPCFKPCVCLQHIKHYRKGSSIINKRMNPKLSTG